MPCNFKWIAVENVKNSIPLKGQDKHKNETEERPYWSVNNRLYVNGLVLFLWFPVFHSFLTDISSLFTWKSLCCLMSRQSLFFLFCSVAIVTAPPPACMRWATSSSQLCVTPSSSRTSSRARPRRPGDACDAKTSECLTYHCTLTWNQSGLIVHDSSVYYYKDKHVCFHNQCQNIMFLFCCM